RRRHEGRGLRDLHQADDGGRWTGFHRRSRFGACRDPANFRKSSDASLTSPNYVVNWGVTFLPYKAVDATINVKHMGGVAAVTWRRGGLRVTMSVSFR